MVLILELVYHMQNSEFDPADVFGESRGLRGSSLTGARLAAIAKESLRQKREGSRRPKSAIEAEENPAEVEELLLLRRLLDSSH